MDFHLLLGLMVVSSQYCENVQCWLHGQIYALSHQINWSTCTRFLHIPAKITTLNAYHFYLINVAMYVIVCITNARSTQDTHVYIHTYINTCMHAYILTYIHACGISYLGCTLYKIPMLLSYTANRYSIFETLHTFLYYNYIL